MHIGLIGGIGPAATVVYYQRLTALMRARKKKLDLTIVQASADELVKNNLSDNRAAQTEIYLDLLWRLKSAGADCAAITSLGGHFCFRETKAASPLPLVSGVKPLDAFFIDQGLSTVGLLGTKVVMETSLYGQLEHTKAVHPGAETQRVADAYIEMATSGQCSDATRALFFDAGRRMVQEKGADAIILAGTDLGLAFDDHDPGYNVIDALDVHVNVLADLACGSRELN